MLSEVSVVQELAYCPGAGRGQVAGSRCGTAAICTSFLSFAKCGADKSPSIKRTFYVSVSKLYQIIPDVFSERESWVKIVIGLLVIPKPLNRH